MKVYLSSRKFWFAVWLTHISMFLFLNGHFRLAVEPEWFWHILGFGEEQVEFFSAASGTVTGLIFIGGVTSLLIRRLSSTMREISLLEDYFILVLLLVIALTGEVMRFFPGENPSTFLEKAWQKLK